MYRFTLQFQHPAPVLMLALFAVAVFSTPASGQAHETALSDGGMVSSQQWIASQVGADVLAAGGNAVDAAIATGFALAVTHPTAGNIGGGGFMAVSYTHLTLPTIYSV